MVKFPSNTKDTIDAIREEIGRNVIFYTNTSIRCTCDLDPITGHSTNPFHTTCSGTGYIHTVSGTTLKAHIYTKPRDVLEWVRGGKLNLGDAGVQIAYSTENLDLSTGCEYVLVDGKKFAVKDNELRGVPEINRILLSLKELTD
jgi:hypothetical protein